MSLRGFPYCESFSISLYSGRFVNKGHRIQAESSGTLHLVLQKGSSHRYVQANFPNGRFFILPTTVREYIFEIGGKEHFMQVPAEFDMDELISKMLELKLKIGVYPVPSKNWLDFGQWTEYHASKNEMRELTNV